MSPKVALKDGFSLWLDEQTTFRPHAQMDPFQTSNRSTKVMAENLPEIREHGISTETGGNPTRTANQRLIDMRQILLVEPKSKPGSNRLTEFGDTVLSKWETHDLIGDGHSREIGRAAVMINEALNCNDLTVRDFYGQMFIRWGNLIKYTPTNVSPLDYWLKDLNRIYLPSFLDFQDSRGYNPFRALVAASGSGIGDSEAWAEWARDEDWPQAGKLHALLSKIKDTYRIGGSRAFRQGIELVRVARNERSHFPIVLKKLEIES